MKQLLFPLFAIPPIYILFFLFTSYSLFSMFKDRLQAVGKLFLPLFRNDTISLE